MFSTAVICVLIVGAAPETKREADKRRATELIPKLGHNFFRVREQASRDLASLGSAAKDALEAGLKHSDMEIRDRCQKLLPKAIELHLNEQIERFLAKPNGPLPPDLPALKRWAKVVGSDKESRELYRDIVKNHQKVLIDLQASPDRASELYQTFMREAYERRVVGVPGGLASYVDPSEVALFLFMGTDPDCRKSAAVNYTYGNFFLSSPHLTQKLMAENGSPVLRKLFAAWLEEENTPILISRGFRLVAQCEIKECAPAALKVSGMKSLVGVYRSYALISLLRVGSKEMVDDPAFQKLLEDKSVIRAGVNGAEIRDVALGVAVELSGQKLSDYGFDRVRPANKAAFLSYIYFSLGTDEKRESAHKKWKQWAEEQKKKKK